jgi:hypothetical protein
MSAAIALWAMKDGKIQGYHRDRLAVVYVGYPLKAGQLALTAGL